MKQISYFGKLTASLLVLLFIWINAAVAQTGEQYVCAGVQFTYSISEPTAYNITWTATGGTIQGSSTSTIVRVVWSSVQGPKEIKCVYTWNEPIPDEPVPSAGPAAEEVNAMTITLQKNIYLVSAGSISGSVVNSCSPAQGTLTLSGHNGTVARWEYSTDGLTWVAVNNTTTTYNYTFYDEAYVRAVVSNPGNTCTVNTMMYLINVEPVPPAPGVTGASRCDAGPVTLTASGAPAGGSYNWYNASNVALGVTTATYTPTITASTTYYVAIKAMSGCEGPKTAVSAAILTPPEPPTTTGASRCGTGSVTLSAAGAPQGSYRWYTSAGALISGATSSTYATPSLSATTTYRVSVVDASGCESSTWPVIATIQQVTAGTISGSVTTSCSPAQGTLTLSGHNGTVARWEYSTDGLTWITINNTSNTYTYNHAQETYVRAVVRHATNSSCTATTSMYLINVEPLPGAPGATGGSRCDAGPVTLTASGAPYGGSYNWYTASGTALGVTTATYTPTITASTTYYVAIKAMSGCEGPKTAVSAAVLTPPEPPTTTGARRCGTGSVTLSAAGAPQGSYRWYTSAGALISGATSYTYTTPSLSATTTYRVSVVDASGCESSSWPVVATIDQVTAGTISESNITQCTPARGTLTLSGHSGNIVRWEYSTDGFTWNTINNTTNTYAYTYYQETYIRAVVRHSSNTSCTATTPMYFINVEPLPNAPTVTNASRCGPGQVTLMASGAPSGGSYSWYNASNVALGITTATYTTPTISATTNYYVAIKGINGCEGPKTLVTATITTPPNAPTVSGASRCGAGQVTLSASGGTQGNYRWYTAAGALISGATSSTYITPSISATTSYGVSVVNAAGCEGSKATVTATIVTVAAPTVTGATICGAGNVTLTATGAPGGSSYKWYSAATGGVLLQQSTSGTYSTFVSGTTSFYVSIFNGSCESIRKTVTATVNVPPAGPVGSSGIRCGPGAVTLSATGAATGESYRWYGAATGGSVLATTQSYTTPSLTNSTTYYVSLMNGGSCESPRTAVAATIDAGCMSPGGNYITTNTILKEGVTAVTQIASLTADDLQKVIAYVDGFGRPIQNVSVQESPSKKDVVGIIEYDAFNRQPKEYLPYAITGTGAFRSNAKSELTAFYGANAATNKVATTAYPYTPVSFEASPLDKVLEKGSAGEAWQLSTGKTVKTTTRPCDANEVRIWNYNFTDGSISSPGFYTAGDVMAVETRDENGNTGITYTDKRGLKIMNKRQVSATDSALTYTVYDAFGNTRATIQPEGLKELQQTNTWTLSATFIDKWCFTYRYDEWQRQVEAKRPGAAVEYTVYNKKDQPVLTQNGELRKSTKWMFIKYDALGRAVSTGTYQHSTALTQAQMQALAANNAGYESRTSENYSNQHGYTVAESFPQLVTGNYELLIVNYFDDYDFDRNSVTPPTSFIALGRSTEPVPSYRAAGFATGTKKKVLGDAKYLTNTVIYNEKGKVIQTIVNNVLNGNDITTIRMDFTGAVLEKVIFHGGSGEIFIKQQHTYDHRRRMKKTTHQVERNEVVYAAVTISDQDYNELGQMIVKKLHSTDGVNYLQNVDYAYNIRGWLSRINDANLSGANDLFGMELKYNEGLLSPHTVSPRFDGTISEIWWKDSLSNKKQSYAYSYNKMDQMLSAQYAAANGAGWTESGGYDESATYDLNGNIKTLLRYQWLTATAARQLTDQLVYTYAGNQLKQVEDNAGAGAAAGFVNGAITTEEYTYDANGSLLTDKNKGITAITSNVVNLPAEIVFGTRGRLVFKYHAGGERLSKQMILPTGATTTTDYINGFEYVNGVLQSLTTPEGRVLLTSSGPGYEYSLKDHLGNVRVNFDKNPSTGKARIIQKTDYYPYGMTMPASYISGLQNKYQYNSKELQNELGLDWYLYGARMYDPQIARWNTVDPMSSKYLSTSPYNYVLANPVSLIDPTGMEVEEADILKDKLKKQINKQTRELKPARAMQGSWVVTDAGHGIGYGESNNDPGAGLVESDYALMLESEATKALRQNSIHNVRTRSQESLRIPVKEGISQKDEQIFYRNRVFQQTGANVFVSFHLDHVGDNEAVTNSIRIMYHPGGSDEYQENSIELANEIQSAMVNDGLFPGRSPLVVPGVPPNTGAPSLGVLRNIEGANNAAVLIEFGNVNPGNGNLQYLEQNREAIGRAVARGIMNYANNRQ